MMADCLQLWHWLQGGCKGLAQAECVTYARDIGESRLDRDGPDVCKNAHRSVPVTLYNHWAKLPWQRYGGMVFTP